jgi:uncharacterized protein
MLGHLALFPIPLRANPYRPFQRLPSFRAMLLHPSKCRLSIERSVANVSKTGDEAVSHRPFFERFMAATRAGDKAALAEMVHPEFELIEPTGVPYEGTFRGLAGWRKLARAVVEAWEDFSVEPIAFPGESEDSFVVKLRLSGRSRKTGRAFEMSVLELWTFRDGKLIGISPHYFDTHLLAKIDAP